MKNARFNLTTATALLLALVPNITHAATLPASEDTVGFRGKLTLAASKSAVLPVDATHKAFVYFNLSDLPAAATIRYARLRLYLPKVIRAGSGLAVQATNGAWDEALPSIEPQINSTVITTFPSEVLGAKRFVSVDITPTVQAWLNAPATNEGLAITSIAGATSALTASVHISAKEGSGSGYPAELEVELVPETIADGAITANKLAPGVFGTVQTAQGSQLAQAGTSYLAVGAELTTFTLPSTADLGAIVKITGADAGGWDVQAAAGAKISGLSFGLYWTPKESVRYWNSIASSTDGTKLVATESVGKIYTSSDSGENWTPRDSDREWNAVASSMDGTKLVAVVGESGAGSPGQIYTSTDSGENWIPRDSNRYWESVASSSDGSKLVAVVNGGQIYTSTDSGVIWTPRENDRDWTSVASSSDGSKLVAVVFDGQIYTSTDSGVNWTARDADRGWSSVASSADGNKLAAGVHGGQIYTSTDSGISWSPRDISRNWSSITSSADGTKLMAVNFIDPQAQLYTSTNSGVSWTAVGELRNWSSVACSSDASKLFASASDDYIYVSALPLSLSGVQGEVVEMQYVGDGNWMPVRSAESLIQRENLFFY